MDLLTNTEQKSEQTFPDLLQTEGDKPLCGVQSKKRIRVRKDLLVLCWILSVLLTACACILPFVLHRETREQLAIEQAMDLVKNEYYFYDAAENDLVEGALKGIAEATGDRYAYYYTAEEYAELTQSNSGEYVGIGILVEQLAVGTFVIAEVYADSPADEAGIAAGDQLLKVNGIASDDYELDAFLGLISVVDGADTELTLLRDGTMFTVTVTAREVIVPAVTWRMLENRIGYLHIASFHGHCVEETEQALKKMMEQGMRGLILDVRDNLGGSLYDVCDIADFFLNKDDAIVTLRSRTLAEEVFLAEEAPLIPSDGSLPIVLLVNAYSASASELFAGALQDHGIAYVIGENTFGKGIVQSYYSISETGGYLKLTTEAYYTPNGVCVQDAGIHPDQTVPLSEEAKQYPVLSCPYELDLQLQAAIAYLNGSSVKKE